MAEELTESFIVGPVGSAPAPVIDTAKSRVRYGGADPSNTLGGNTDFYLNIVSGDWFYKDSDVWGKIYAPTVINDFFGSFTSTNSTGFVWSSNTLTITHNLNRNIKTILMEDNTGVFVYYTREKADNNTIKIYFPINQIPISGVWKIMIS